MQGLLSFEQAPPISAPFRFFMTAPLFAILAGMLLLWSGPDLFASRWTPAALALTHLITAGFMLQAMLGAMLQLLPVMAGANMARPLLVAGVVHAAITLGALILVAAFLTYQPLLFGLAVVFLGTGVTVFVAAAAYALHGVESPSPTIHGLKLALMGLVGTVGLGLLLAVSLGWSLGLPLVQLANIHLSWGFVAWGCALLATVGAVAVPMFQLTPDYPGWFGRSFSYVALGVVSLWTLADLAGWSSLSMLLSVFVVLTAATFALLTLNIQRQSRRPKLDVVQLYWRLAMFSALVACALWLGAQAVPALAGWSGWPLLFGVLLLFGGFMSVIVGMLYKISPFLVWLHLQNLGRGRVVAPNMKKVLAEVHMERQMFAHFVAFALLLLAVFWPAWFAYPAGIALIVANGWLMRNLLSAVGVYRAHLVKIEAAVAASAASGQTARQ
jgi:hypothetical protein